MLNLKTVAIGATLVIASIGAFAQATAPVAPATPRVDAREAKQQARIDNGVDSGQLTARETNRLDKQQARIASAETKAKADGTVTPAEHRHLTRMQNRASANIAKQKHDAQVAPKAYRGAAPVAATAFIQPASSPSGAARAFNWRARE